jgi:hypothetical protein
MKKLTAVIALALLSACSSYEIGHDYDVEADFDQYRTYRWMPLAPDSTAQGAAAARTQNTLLDKRIRGAVDESLAAKGFTPDEDDPDVLVVYHTGLKDRVDVTDWGYTYSGSYWGWAGRDVDVYNYTEGTLIVDLVDAGSKQLVWRGSATGVVRADRSPEERDRVMKDVVAKMFAKYPPRR